MRRPFDRQVGHVALWLEERGRELEPDPVQARRFLELLDPDADFFSFRTFSETPYTRVPGGDPLERSIHAPFEQCWDELVGLNRAGAAVAVTINATNGRGRKIDDILRVRALFLDLDRPELCTKPLAPEPDISVESSPGRFHHYWLTSGMPPAEFVPAQRALARRYGGDHKVCALNQAMALPGFWRRKALGTVSQTRLPEPVAGRT